MITGIVAVQMLRGGGDPHWANVSALLHLNGADGGTVFADETGKEWTATGQAVTKTDQSLFNGSSLYTDGSGDRIATGSHADFNFGTGDFTIEAAILRQNNNSTVQLLGMYDGATAVLRVELVAPGGGVAAALRLYVGGEQVLSSSNLIPAIPSPWAHVALVRLSGAYTFYIDGDAAGTSVVRADNLVQSGFQFAGNQAVAACLLGHAAELRVTKGIARYTVDFTPPTAPYPNN